MNAIEDYIEATYWRRAIIRQPVPPAAPKPAGKKRCFTCQEVKATTEFYPRSYQRPGVMLNCKCCHIAKVQRRMK